MDIIMCCRMRAVACSERRQAQVGKKARNAFQGEGGILDSKPRKKSPR